MKISETTINCCKPNRFIPFKSIEERSENSGRKPRYKRFVQMSDDVLSLKSIIKAHDEVSQSNKMRLFTALPHITTALLGTTIALAQPGKLAARAAAGLGFLALTNVVSDGISFVARKVDSKKENKNKTLKDFAIGTAQTVGAIGIGALALVGIKKASNSKFLKNEAIQLAKEINETKLGKIVEEKLNPFVQKNASKFSKFMTYAPLGIALGSTSAQVGLANSLSNDIKVKAVENFAKGKYIQAQARAHFDSIDAEEI